MNQKIETSIRTNDDDDDDDNDKLLLHDNANSGFEDITILHNAHNWNETKIQINSLTRLQHSDQNNQQQPASKIPAIANNQENIDQIADLRRTEYDDEHSVNMEEQQEEQKISGINKNDIHRSYQLSDIANYLTYNRRIAVGDTKDSRNKQILGIIHNQKLLNEDEESKISIIKNERAKLTIATTITTNSAATISGPLITGYPDETSHSTRRRFIYVTKRPILH